MVYSGFSSLMRPSSPSWYLVGTAASAAAGLAMVPAVVVAGGATDFAAFAFGQSAGVVGSVFIGMGYAITGPRDVAQAVDADRRRQLWSSLAYRVPVAALVFFIGAAVSWLSFPDSAGVSTLAFLGTSLSGFSCSWYYIGLQRARSLFFYETLWRALFTLLGASLLFLGSDVMIGLAAVPVGIVTSLWFVAVRERASAPTIRANSPRLLWVRVTHGSLDHLLAQRVSLGVAAASSMQLAAPMLLATWLNVPSLAQIALVDKLSRQAYSASAPLVQALQGWVPNAAEPHAGRGRQRRALWLGLAGAVALFTGFAVLGRPLSQLLGAGSIEVDISLVVAAAAFSAACLLERIVSRATLIPARRENTVLVANLVGLAVGCVGVLLLDAEGHPSVIMWSLAFGTAVSAATQIGFWLRSSRTR